MANQYTIQHPLGGQQGNHQLPTGPPEKANLRLEVVTQDLKTLIQKSDGLSQQQGNFNQEWDGKEGPDGKIQIPYLRQILSKQQQRYDHEDRKLQEHQKSVRDQLRLLARNFDYLTQKIPIDGETTNRLGARCDQYLVMRRGFNSQRRNLRKRRKCHLRKKRCLEADKEFVACFEELKQEKQKGTGSKEGSTIQQSNVIVQAEKSKS